MNKLHISEQRSKQIIIAALRYYDEAIANSDGDALGWVEPEPSPTDLEVRLVRQAVESLWGDETPS